MNSGGFSDIDWTLFPIFSFDLDSLEWREIVRKRNSSFSFVQGRVGDISIMPTIIGGEFLSLGEVVGGV